MTARSDITDDLKPCPFCGGSANTVESCERWFVSCSECYCCVGEAYDASAMPEHMFYDQETAIEAWNRRAEPPLPAPSKSTARPIADSLVTAAQAMLDAYDVWTFNDEPERLRAELVSHQTPPHETQQGLSLTDDSQWRPIGDAPFDKDGWLKPHLLGIQRPWGWESWVGQCDADDIWLGRTGDGSMFETNPPTHYAPLFAAPVQGGESS